jgi:hypothetical protein
VEISWRERKASDLLLVLSVRKKDTREGLIYFMPRESSWSVMFVARRSPEKEGLREHAV